MTNRFNRKRCIKTFNVNKASFTDRRRKTVINIFYCGVSAVINGMRIWTWKFPFSRISVEKSTSVFRKITFLTISAGLCVFSKSSFLARFCVVVGDTFWKVARVALKRRSRANPIFTDLCSGKTVLDGGLKVPWSGSILVSRIWGLNGVHLQISSSIARNLRPGECFIAKSENLRKILLALFRTGPFSIGFRAFWQR